MVAACLEKQTQIKFNKTLAELYSCFEELGFSIIIIPEIEPIQTLKKSIHIHPKFGKGGKRKLERFSWNNLESLVLWSREGSEYNDTRGKKGERGEAKKDHATFCFYNCNFGVFE